ncbi:MAG: FG-GAP-like repeat-containing protein, partial [Candidatus Marinimicrobia bacterium]|nr:FG-GAP-like repeat-containing protein [Candidatus Neomarinimicrobiota bacterium]
NCFSDIEEGGNLQYTIDYNSDTTLVQADVDSESGAFDLNFQENAYGQAEIIVKATDSGELWAKDSFSVFVRAVNDTPFVADPIPDVKVNEDCPDSNSHVDLNNVFHDVEEKDSLNFTIMNNTNPSLVEASIGSEDSTLDLSFTPDSNGTAWLKIRASDSTGLFTEDSFKVQIASVNDTPFVIGSIPDITVEEDAPDSIGHYDLENAFDDIEEGNQLSYTIANNSTPDLVNVEIDKNKLNFQFLQNATGQAEITIKARDSGKLFAQTSFSIEVTPVNDAPKIITRDSIQVTEDQYFVYPPSVFDPDGPDTIFTFDNLPEWLSSSADSVYGRPEEGTADTSFRIIASDGLLADTMVVELAVDSVNDAPQIISDSSLTATEDSLFNYIVVAEDPDNIILDYQYIGLPSWLTAEKDKVSGTPREGSQDTSFTVVVSDPLSSDSLKVNIDYISINDKPFKTGQIPDIIVDEDAPDSLNHVSLDEIFHDEEDDGQLSYQVFSNSNPKLVDVEIGEQSALNFSFYPQANGKSEIIVEGSDSGGLHVRDSFLVVVNSINDRPEIVKNIPDVIVNEDASDSLGHVDLNNIFNDVEQEGNLQFTIVENTKESVFAAEINSVDSTLDLSFQPDSHGVGQVKIRATDSSGLSIDEEFRIVVNSVNDSPFIIDEIQDIDVKEDSPDLNNYVDLNNIFSDVEDGSNLNFAIVKNSRPGLLDVMIEPSDSSVNISFSKDSSGLTNITIRATDSDNGFVEDSFKINIEAINDRPLLISLDSIQITEDEYFSYQPKVTDPDGPDTIFTYLNVPGWLETTPDSVYGIPLEGTPDTSFGIVASDGLAFDTMLVELEVDSVNDAPDIVSDGDLIAYEDSLFSYQLIAQDPDNIELNYKYRDLPSWLSADENLISGTPLQGSTDTSFIAIVSDDYSSDSLLINIDYIPVNDKPYLTKPIPDLNTEEDASDMLDFVNLENIFQDEEDGDSLTYEILLNSNTNLVEIVLDTAKKNLDCLFLSNAYGQAEIIISARDRENSKASDTFQVNVSSVNDKPVVAQSIPDIRVDEDAPDSIGHVDLNNVFYDIEEKSNLDFSINNSNPSILDVNINSKDSTLDLAFEPDSNGSSNITVRATDSSGLFVEDQFKITINSVNDVPSVITGIPDLQVDEDSPDSRAYADLNDVFYDIENGHDLIFSVAKNSNPGLLNVNINPGDSTLDLGFIPDSAGIANITIRATDFHGASIEEKFQITVNSINDAPQITSKRYTETTEHQKYVYYVQAHDPDDINLDITIDQLPEWLETDSDSVFGITPEGAQDNDFRIVASDGLLSDTLLVEVAVDSVNDPPQITSPDSIFAIEEEEFVYSPEVTDPDNNIHTFIYKDLPAWVSTRNDSLFGIPPEGVDSTNFQLIASDEQLQDTIIIFVNIKPINDPPIITSGDSIRVAEDQNLAYQITVDDPDNSNFQYTFTDLPSWMSSEGGEVSGTPGEGVEDTSFVVVVSDGEYSDLKQIYVEVIAVQDAPDIITENLKAGYEQAQYQDSIEAVDSDIDDQLSYYLLKSPKWLSIDSLSGKLSGVPDHKNVGINIPVSVMVEDLAGLSDTMHTTINVYDTLAPGVPQNLSGTPGSQKIYLSWSPVQDNDFDKYRIYYDTDRHPTQSKLATIGGQRNDTSITITELDKDKEYYIRITAIDSAGNVSGFSNEITLKPGLITSIYPRPNMTAVSADTSLKVTFGKALDQNTTADSNFYVYGSQYGYMEGELIIGQQYIEFMPNDEFYPGERVSVIITERIKFEDGSRLANGYSWRYDIVSQGGSGFFALEERYNTDYDVREISAGDFDENRDIEIVAGSDRAHINYFNLNRNENEGVRYNASTNSYDVTSADFDLDGDRDIASLYYHEGGKINVWYNDGNGKFPDRTDYFNVLDDTDGGLSNLKSGDIDNDGDQDLIGVANFGDSDMDQVVIIFNDGQGNFNSSKKVDVEPYSEFQYYRNNFDLVDYDLNGTQDILVKAGNNKVKVLFNSGNAEFERSKTVLNSYNINTLECTDIDGDGDCDLLIGDSERLGIFKKQDTLLVGTFEYDVNDYIHNIISKDFNNDGHRDIIVGGQDSPHSMVVLLNDGQNNFNSPINIQNQGQINYLYSFDRDNDGDLDLVTSHYDHEHIEVWRNRNRNQDIMTARESLNFGSLPLQTKDTMKLNIWNDGLYKILDISDISISSAEFTVDKSTASLSPDDTLDLEVIFQPTEPGVYEDKLEIYSDDPDQPIKEINLQASASNYISGGVITKNTTWSADQSPYYIQNNVAVDLGVSLTIEPGAIIQFAPEAGLIVDGELQARGSVSDSIIFIGDQSQRFNNLKFRSGSNINLEYFRVDGAGIEISSTDTDLRYGIVKNGNDYGVYIVDCEVSLSQIEVAGFNNYGVYARRDDDQFGLYVDNCKVHDNGNRGIYTQYIDYNHSIKILNSEIYNNSNYGIYCYRIYDGEISGNEIYDNGSGAGLFINDIYNSSATISSNQIYRNNYGIEINQSTTEAPISRNVIRDNRNDGLSVRWSKNLIEYNDIFNNQGDGIEIRDNDNSNTSYLPKINANNIYYNQGYELNIQHERSETVNARQNYWGITDSLAIAAEILNYYDNATSARCDFSDWYNNKVPLLPVDGFAAQTLSEGRIKLNWIFHSRASQYFLYTDNGSGNLDTTNVWKILDSTYTNYTSTFQDGQYELAIQAKGRDGAVSPLSTISALADGSNPEMLSATGVTGDSTITVTFNENLDISSILDLNNWQLSNNLEIREIYIGGLIAEYYNGQNFDELVTKDTIYQPINFNWEYGAPIAGINPDNFS